MGWSDVLLWMAGMSWAYAVVMAITRARVGEYHLARHLGLMAMVAAVAWLVFPAAIGAILVGLWLVTMFIPSLLYRLMVRLSGRSRNRAVILLSRIIGVMQPLGPLAVVAVQFRHLALLQSGDAVAASSLATRMGSQPEAVRRSLELRTLLIERRWPELLAAVGSRSDPEALVYRMRALAETGDLAGMVATFPAAAAHAPGNAPQFRQYLGVMLAFGGRAEAVAALLTAAEKANRDFWTATAWWAAGDEARARAALTAIVAPPGSGIDSAIAWRLAHPPALIANAAPEVQAEIARIAALALPVAARPARPWLTWSLMAACVVMYGITLTYADYNEGLWALGALDTRLDPLANWWRFIAASFLHVNFPHIAMNMWALALFGPVLERAQGRWRFAAIYLGAGIGAAVMVTVVAAFKHIDTGMVGASGAIMGLIGAQLLTILRYRDPAIPWTKHPQIQRMLWIVVMQTAFDMTHPQVSQSGHIGGFIAGFIIAFLVTARRPRAVAV